MKSRTYFTAVGITDKPSTGPCVRFTNNLERRAYISFCDGYDTRFEYIRLRKPMTRLEATLFLKRHPDFQSPHDQRLIDDMIRMLVKNMPNYKLRKYGLDASQYKNTTQSTR